MKRCRRSSRNRGMSRLTNQLLALARIEPAATTCRTAPVDLVGLAAPCWRRWRRGRSTVAGSAFEASLPGARQVEPTLLQELVANLVDNAIRYTPTGDGMTVCGGAPRDDTILAVEDTGPGLPDGEKRAGIRTILVGRPGTEIGWRWQRARARDRPGDRRSIGGAVRLADRCAGSGIWAAASRRLTSCGDPRPVRRRGRRHPAPSLTGIMLVKEPAATWRGGARPRSSGIRRRAPPP